MALRVCQRSNGGMFDVGLIDDPAAAVVALDPVRARLLAELAEPARRPLGPLLSHAPDQEEAS
jgi:hypothetical protein